MKDLYDDLAVSDGLAVKGFLVALNRYYILTIIIVIVSIITIVMIFFLNRAASFFILVSFYT